jgi:hypothetical protein
MVSRRIKELSELAHEIDEDSGFRFGWEAKRLGLLKYEHSTATCEETQTLTNRHIANRKQIYEDDKIIVEKENGSLGFLFWVKWKRKSGEIVTVGYY